MLNAIIMASGYGKRMGENKLLLSYKGKSLIEWIIEKVLESEFSNRIVIARDKYVIDLVRKKGIKVVVNEKAHLGKSESIKLGIENLPLAQGYMFFTADQPLIKRSTIQKLIDNFKQNKDFIIVPKYKDKKGSPVIFPNKFVDELLLLKGDNGGKIVINKHMDKVKFVDINEGYELLDIDTVEDYKKLILLGDNSTFAGEK
ncbi:molybdenum cofactor cytidylyltransferase [Haloimpatiens sp. FM7330]|uniref:molybdenum cofactor cytidylyltransferase n=1 Tax=Haloimpatiens sp. FM7330 TaxID=3298610 RepID=UPI003636E928